MKHKWRTNEVPMIKRWSTNELEMYKCINVSVMFDETYQEQCRQQWWLKSQLLTHKYSNQQLHTETHCPRRYQPARPEARFMTCSSTLRRLIFTLYRIWAFSADTELSGAVWTPIRHVNLYFRDRRGGTSTRLIQYFSRRHEKLLNHSKAHIDTREAL